MPDLSPMTTVPGVLSAQVDGIDGAAVVCTVPGGPIALTLGNKTHVVTAQFDAKEAIEMAAILNAAADVAFRS